MEERPPIWRVATNIFNKQSRTADKGWSFSLGVQRGANNSSPKKLALLRNRYTCLGVILWYDLSYGKGDHLEDPSVDGRIILRWIFRKLGGGMDGIDVAQDRDR
jgi:hypothetical protein